MWVVLFTAIIVAAICLSAAAIWLGLDGKDPSDRIKPEGFIRAQFPPEPQDLSPRAHVVPKQLGTCNAMRPVVHHLKAFPDIDLLLRRMAVLSIEPEEVEGLDPLLFRELQGRCTLCRSRGTCAYDFADDACSRDWKEYCPNATVLSLLSSTHQAAFSASSGARLHS
jgi:hypothetical protein